MVPLIDVTFLLLTYFMMASHYASTEKPDIALPQPHESQARDVTIPEKIYVNMLYAGPQAESTLMLGPMRMNSLAELREMLNSAGRSANPPEVILRADRHIPYGQVRQVMEAIAAANLPNLKVVAELEPAS